MVLIAPVGASHASGMVPKSLQRLSGLGIPAAENIAKDSEASNYKQTNNIPLSFVSSYFLSSLNYDLDIDHGNHSFYIHRVTLHNSQITNHKITTLAYLKKNYLCSIFCEL